MDNESVKKKHTQNNIALTVVVVAAIIIIAAILSVSMLTIFRGNSTGKKEYTASYLASEVVKKMNYENLSEISGSNISKYYEIPDGVVSDSVMYISTRPDSFTELACFKLKNQDKEEQLLDIINAHIADKSRAYQNVNETTSSVVSTSRIFDHYPYVFVVVSADSDTAVNTFASLIEAGTKEQNKS